MGKRQNEEEGRKVQWKEKAWRKVNKCTMHIYVCNMYIVHNTIPTAVDKIWSNLPKRKDEDIAEMMKTLEKGNIERRGGKKETK